MKTREEWGSIQLHVFSDDIHMPVPPETSLGYLHLKIRGLTFHVHFGGYLDEPLPCLPLALEIRKLRVNDLYDEPQTLHSDTFHIANPKLSL